jgi:hypothetical protein
MEKEISREKESSLFPFRKLLTLPLDLGQFRLCGDLCDAFHCDPLHEYSTLRKREHTTGWDLDIWEKTFKKIH